MSTGITQIDPSEVKKYETQSLEHGYIVRCLLAFDVLCNVVFFKGRLDETISAHSARAAMEGKLWGIWMSKFLDIFQKNHGAQAILGDEARANVISETEKDSNIIK